MILFKTLLLHVLLKYPRGTVAGMLEILLLVHSYQLPVCWMYCCWYAVQVSVLVSGALWYCWTVGDTQSTVMLLACSKYIHVYLAEKHQKSEMHCMLASWQH